jgi:hypothetical protein
MRWGTGDGLSGLYLDLFPDHSKWNFLDEKHISSKPAPNKFLNSVNRKGLWIFDIWLLNKKVPDRKAPQTACRVFVTRPRYKHGGYLLQYRYCSDQGRERSISSRTYRYVALVHFPHIPYVKHIIIIFKSVGRLRNRACSLMTPLPLDILSNYLPTR